MRGTKLGTIIAVAAAMVGVTLTGSQAEATRGRGPSWNYRFTETVQVPIINGAPSPQFNYVDVGPEGFSVGDQLLFTADEVGEDRRGNPVTGTMVGQCVVTGVEPRVNPLCIRPQPDGSCLRLEPLSPFFMCTQTLRIPDPTWGVDGFSQLQFHGFVRQIEAQGDPPGQNQVTQWLAVTGGTGRFRNARGEASYDLVETDVPPPIKTLEIYLQTGR